MSNGLILIVDDMPTNLEVISSTLEDAGFEVAIALDGLSAIEQAQLNEELDLILLDVMMPGIDGFETCQRLKSNPTTSHIPIIFMTALSDTTNKVRALELGAVDYITKPFSEQEVLARVKTQTKLYRLSRSLEQQVVERTTQLSEALAELKTSQIQLVQREKLSALGNLVAGVAHEINNPIGFLSGNIEPALEYINDIFGLVDLYQQEYPQPSTTIQNEIKTIDLDYIREDLPKLVGSMREGVRRITDISTSLRTFSRADTERPVLCNLHDGIDSTILILKHRLKANEERPAIDVITDYGDLPQIECFPGQLNQVFMNILANAIDALEDSNNGRTFKEIQANPNRIIIKTRVKDNQIQVAIADNGIGMSEQVKEKIFDHLFTTKAVGQGTGLGLAIAHQIITEKHNGLLFVNSTPGKGTEFLITIPILAEIRS
ncbi:response regulator [Nostoc sp. ATCC 53789]|uniref:sensor histidine kinase n=1 Tax=Nostoc sp. ATCC 53789 TaxID=76335 RepID=UPI000DED2E3A|nr:response regulator [Nostoc sp. ATCC 53789]QHG17456.1 response regulator [Nostoc sp. ATCC 53789]RCJ31680.1 hybrid sensor histidine kinase/response regulator [Nostoc sp. ATCC 53789]